MKKLAQRITLYIFLLCRSQGPDLVCGNPTGFMTAEPVAYEIKSCAICREGVKECFVCYSATTSFSGTSDKSIKPCPPEIGTKLEMSRGQVEEANDSCYFLKDDMNSRSQCMWCRESQITDEDHDPEDDTQSYVFLYVLTPLMFFIGLFLGIFCYFLFYVKLRFILCPCRSGTWEPTDIFDEAQELPNDDIVVPIQLVWGPDIPEDETVNMATEDMVGTAPKNILGPSKKNKKSTNDDGERHRYKLISLGHSQTTLVGLPDPEAPLQVPLNVNLDLSSGHHGGDVTIHGPEDGEQASGAEETAGQEQHRDLQLAVPKETDLEHFLEEVNDLAEHATEQNTWKDFNFVGSTFAAGLFDFDGGHLTLDEIGIDLFIPPGALNTRDPELIYIYVSKEHSASLSEDHVSLSSTIYCGPDGLRFEERVVLSYHHCALNARDVKVVTLFTNTHVGHQPNFRDLATDEACFSFVMGQKCFLFVNHFTGFTTVANVGEGQHVRKTMDVMCYFDSLMPEASHLSIRIYCVNQTSDAKKLVWDEELVHGGAKIGDGTRQIILDSSNETDLEFMIKEISPKGWKVNNSPHRSIKSIILNNAQYCATSYRLIKEDRTKPMLECECSLDFYQHGNDTASQVSPQTISISVSEDKAYEEKERLLSRFLTKMKQRVQPQLGYAIRLEISYKLDPPCALGKDWKLFADKIGFDCDTINQIDDMFKRRIIHSPTVEVLNLWDAQKRTMSVDHLKNLKKIFEDIGREDAALIVQSVVEKFEESHDPECEGASGGH